MGFDADLVRVIGLRQQAMRLEVVVGEHFDDVEFVAAPDILEMPGDTEVERPPIALRQRLVGDVADQVLDESVLPSLW